MRDATDLNLLRIMVAWRTHRAPLCTALSMSSTAVRVRYTRLVSEVRARAGRRQNSISDGAFVDDDARYAPLAKQGCAQQRVRVPDLGEFPVQRHSILQPHRGW